MFFLPPAYTNTDEEITDPDIENPLTTKFPLPNGSWYMQCAKCANQSQWSEPNQDNGTFICYKCRNDIEI